MTPGFRAFVEGLAAAVVFVGACLLVMFLGGCANGVQMTDEEAVACRDSGCAVFTEIELRSLVGRALEAGYRKGWGDATRQNSKDL